jgi:hypothetical protein
MKITKEIVEAHLNCKTKAHLKLAGETGTKSDYEVMSFASKEDSRAKALARFGVAETCRGMPLIAATLKQGAPLLVDVTFEDESLSLRFDALKRVEGAYVPVLHHDGDKVGKHQKVLLAVYALVLGRLQGQIPAFGLIARGSEGRGHDRDGGVPPFNAHGETLGIFRPRQCGERAIHIRPLGAGPDRH